MRYATIVMRIPIEVSYTYRRAERGDAECAPTGADISIHDVTYPDWKTVLRAKLEDEIEAFEECVMPGRGNP